MSAPAKEIAGLCPRCHEQSLVEIRGDTEVLKPVEHTNGSITREETSKEVVVRVCSSAKCGYRSDDA